MRPGKVFLIALIALSCLLLQVTALNRLGLPAGRPYLPVLAVVAVALYEGPLVGSVLGFGTGLLADLAGDHLVGRLALALAVVGYAAGLLREEDERSAVIPVLVVGASSALLVLANGLLGVLFGQPHLSGAGLARSAGATALYDVVLAPFIYPAVRGMLRLLDPQR